MGRPLGSVAYRVAGNGASTLVSRVVAAAVSMVTVPVLYARLGGRQFGVWAVLTGAMSVVALFDMGLGSCQVREVARAISDGCHRRARAVLGLGVVWAVVSGALLVAATIACWPSITGGFHLGGLSRQARTAVLLLEAGVVCNGLTTPWQAVLEGAQQYTVLALATGAVLVGGAVLAVLAVTRGGGLVGLAASAAAGSAARAVVLAAAARRRVPDFAPDLRCVSRGDLLSVARYGTRVQLSNAAAAINNETDRLVLAGFSSPSMVAGFDLGSRLVNVVRMPASSALATLFPAAVALTCGGSGGSIDRLYVQTTRYLTVYAAVVTAALAVSADQLVRLWVGHRVPLADTTLVMSTLGSAINITSGAAAVVTRSEGRPGRETRYALLAAALNAVLTLPLLKALGPVGVPLSSMLAISIATCYFFAHFHRASGRAIRPVLRAVLLPAAACAVGTALTWAVTRSLPEEPGRFGALLAAAIRSATAATTVLGLLAGCGYFNRTDWTRLRAVARLAVPSRGTATETDRRTL